MDMAANSGASHSAEQSTAGRGWVRGTWGLQLGQGAAGRGRREVGQIGGRKGEVGGGHKWVEDIHERRTGLGSVQG